MEDPNLAAMEEDDEEFYERIEAPKFVDFTIPDRSRPDDRSWFCARIGCDQNHEEVDPEELNRSFMLRVMAARSPNVRFRRALNSRANTRCPQSAPSKSIKNGISRISTMNSMIEKITMAKLKQHPITSLREAPIQKKKAKVQTLKQTITDNNKSQAKYLKTHDTAVASKDRNLVKALLLHTPKKAAGSSKAPISEICSELKKKKINIDGERKHMNKCKGSSISSKKTSAVGSKNSNHNILKEAEHKEMRDVVIGVGSNGSYHVEENNTNPTKSTGEEHQAIIDSKLESDSEVSIKPTKDEAYIDLQVSSGVGSENKPACNVTNDDDKENTLFPFENKIMHPNAAASEAKNLQFENSTPLLIRSREAKVQNKAFQEVKLKRTTNPKPFRLRTDERGILKEANLERRLQVKSNKEPATLLKHVDGIQERGILKEANLERRLQVKSNKEPSTLLKHVDGIQIQETNSQAKLIRLPEAKLAKSIHIRKLNS